LASATEARMDLRECAVARGDPADFSKSKRFPIGNSSALMVCHLLFFVYSKNRITKVSMKTINQNEFKQEVREFKGVALSEPCKTLSPLLQEMSQANTDPQVKYLKMNAGTERAITEMLGIQTVPTVMIFKDGRIVAQKIGVSLKEEYLMDIEAAKKSDANTTRKVIVFSTPTCPYCHMVKAYLREKQVAFEDIDVSKDEQKATQMVERSGQTGVPQLWIDDLVVVGFNRPQINMVLGVR